MCRKLGCDNLARPGHKPPAGSKPNTKRPNVTELSEILSYDYHTEQCFILWEWTAACTYMIKLSSYPTYHCCLHIKDKVILLANFSIPTVDAVGNIPFMCVYL